MAVRKPAHDPEALVATVDMLTNLIDAHVAADHADAPHAIAEGIAASFRTAEFETVTAKVACETVTMRRLVLTGEWAVQTA